MYSLLYVCAGCLAHVCPQVWAIIVCHFCHNFGTFILLTWMPSYYNQVRGDAPLV